MACIFGAPPSIACRNVNLLNCQFYTGDDSVAGSYWDNAVISGCTLNSSCNGIRLIGPARHLIVNNCLFYGPGQQPHRTSNRTNNLSGIILQPGAWDRTEGSAGRRVDCEQHDARCRVARDDLDEARQPRREHHHFRPRCQRGVPRRAFGRKLVGLAHCARSYFAMPTSSLRRRPGRACPQAVQAPHVDVRPLPAWAVYARNVRQFTLEDVRFSLAKDDARPVSWPTMWRTWAWMRVRFPHVPGVTHPIVTTNVEKVELRHTDPLEEHRREIR